MPLHKNPWGQQVYCNQKARILVVDDESYIRVLIRGSLGQGQYEVHTASGAREARELLEQFSFDLAIVDVNMPGESGLDLLRQVRNSHPGLEVLLMTGAFEISEDLAAASADMPQILLKPLLRGALQEAVDAGLAAAKERRDTTTLEPHSATVAFARQMPEVNATPIVLTTTDDAPTSADEFAKANVYEAPSPPRAASVTLTTALADEDAGDEISIDGDLDEPVVSIGNGPRLATHFRQDHAASSEDDDFDCDRTADLDEMPPQVVAGYTLVRAIAACEFAVVYRAKKEVNGETRKFAVKIIHLDHRAPNAAEKLSRLLDEAEQLKQVEHPCIVKPVARGYDEAQQAPFVVHEFIKGRPLSELMGSPKLTFHLRLRILAEICSAIAVLHGRQLFHRALKPENIVIDSKWHARLIDFGLASTPVSFIDEQALAHRLSFHPPECLAAAPSQDSSDVYALGVVAYEFFAGYNPFLAGSVAAVKQAMRSFVPPLLGDVVAGFPEDLSEDFARVLSKNPDHRPTAIELSMQLRTVLDRVEPEAEIALPAQRWKTIIE
ncbi:MAG: CheY-like chemotaxis protein [Rhodothermales bacterium]|jgi:CheY-like chemotaxis protein